LASPSFYLIQLWLL